MKKNIFKRMQRKAMKEGWAFVPTFLQEKAREYFTGRGSILVYDKDSCHLGMERGVALHSEQELATLIRRVCGGRLYRVGGSVRDEIAGIEPNDYDYVVCGVFNPMAARRQVAAVLEDWRYGGEFPVLRTYIGGEKVEVSFDVQDILHNLEGRDTTMNAMAVDVETGRVIDPFGGMSDVRRGIVRHVCINSFNPLAAFRAARQAIQMARKTGREFIIARETLAVMNNCQPDAAPSHRIRFEWEDAESMNCGWKFMDILYEAGIYLDFDDWGDPIVEVEPIPASVEEQEWEDMPIIAPMWA